MLELVNDLLDGNLVEAKIALEDRINELFYEKLDVLKRKVAENFSTTDLKESNVYKMGREKNIRIRIRKGKIQRRVTKSATPGYVYRNQKLVRMTPQEKRHRKMAARTSRFKRRHELQQSIRKRRVALRRRKALGV
jgi:hypothetical protein